jgi:hypothetical protein
VTDDVAAFVDDLDGHVRLEHVRASLDEDGIVHVHADLRVHDEDRGQEISVVLAGDRLVHDHAFAAEHVDSLAVELEEDTLDRGELGERVDDLCDPHVHGRGAAARLELRCEVDRGDAVGHRQAEKLGAGRDLRAHRGRLLPRSRALEQRLHRRGSDAGS